MGSMDSIEAEVLAESGKRDGKGRRIIGREEQERLVCLYDESGLTQREFCSREGINYHTFVAWLGRRRKVGGGGADEVPGFHQISLVGDHHTVTQLEVVLPDGTALRGIRAGELAELVRLIRGL